MKPHINVDTWLHEALQANNTNALQWLTRTLLHHSLATKTTDKRPRLQYALSARWTCYLRHNRNHLRSVTSAYTMAHIRHPKPGYMQASKVKWYHALITNPHHNGIHLQQLDQRLRQLYVAT